MTSLTATGWVNLALREIGTYRIEDVETGDEPESQIARDVMEQVRLTCLSVHEWRFALKQAELARLGTAPVAQYAYAYQLPADFVRLGRVSDASTMDPLLVDFAMQGDTILSSSDFCFIEYVRDHSTYGAWPAHFVRYAAIVLAAEMSSALKSTTERERLEKLADARLGQARSLDSQSQPVMFRPAGTWLAAMRGSRMVT